MGLQTRFENERHHRARQAKLLRRIRDWLKKGAHTHLKNPFQQQKDRCKACDFLDEINEALDA